MATLKRPIVDQVNGNTTAAARIQLVAIARDLAGRGDVKTAARIMHATALLSRRSRTAPEHRPTQEQIDLVFKSFTKGHSRRGMTADTGLSDSMITSIVQGNFGLPSYAMNGDFGDA